MWSELRERVAQYDSQTADMRLCGLARAALEAGNEASGDKITIIISESMRRFERVGSAFA